ncbi:hypothetical protein QBC36DRAFT_287468 [Triangularia setosa]|uniref:Uncharacterized protein n=1 Tax=Triangularia setosa TaxID=2587417 RepID=A0AAN6WD00_9PEZI|nr:hypothetical protein QBC36DRAFT_287468 [Podospora setosa]
MSLGTSSPLPKHRLFVLIFTMQLLLSLALAGITLISASAATNDAVDVAAPCTTSSSLSRAHDEAAWREPSEEIKPQHEEHKLSRSAWQSLLQLTTNRLASACQEVNRKAAG